MKIKLTLIAVLCALAFTMTFAGNDAKPSTTVATPGNEALSVEERLLEVDFSVTLEQYRKVSAQLLEDELEIFVNGNNGVANERRDRLRAYAEKVRAKVIEYGGMLQKLRDQRRMNSISGK